VTPPLRSVVLVVDDSPGTLGLLNDTLEAAGYTVLLALSGNAALETASRATPDIILLDAVMPGLDGARVIMAEHLGLVTTAIITKACIPDKSGGD